MKKFLVLFMAPLSVLAEWMKTPEAERKAQEKELSAKWQEWTAAHQAMVVEAPAGAGSTKRVTKGAATDVKNEIMMYMVVQAASPEAAAKAFEDHPHLEIPEASIEIMPVRPLPGMSGM